MALAPPQLRLPVHPAQQAGRCATFHAKLSFFTITMSTGSVATSVHLFPFHFPGQQDIAGGFWVLTVLLFVLFSCLLLARALLFSETLGALLKNPNQSLFLGTIPMSMSMIIIGMVTYVAPRVGSAAMQAAHALFWVNFPGVLLCIVLVPFTMFSRHEQAIGNMTAVWLLPVAPAYVSANTAGVVAAAMPNERHGMSVAWLGMAMLGIGTLLSFQICNLYFHRLACHRLPAREVIVSSFLPVGPWATTGWALINMASAAQQHLVRYMHTRDRVSHLLKDEDTQQLVNVFMALACLLGACLWGFATWWLLLAVASVVETMRRGVPFNLGMWGSVFPWGQWACCACALAHMTGSNGFHFIGGIAVACHVLLWAVVMGLTLTRAWSGRLFHAPDLAETREGAAAEGLLDGGRPLPPDVARTASQLDQQLTHVLIGGGAGPCRSGTSLAALAGPGPPPAAGSAGSGHSRCNGVV